MGMTDNNLCKSCINLGCEFQSGIVRTECAFYMPPHIEPDNCGNNWQLNKYPVVARPYTDDMEVKEKFFTKSDMVAMLTEIQLEIRELWDNDPSYIEGVYDAEKVIQQKINSLKEAKDGESIFDSTNIR